MAGRTRGRQLGALLAIGLLGVVLAVVMWRTSTVGPARELRTDLAARASTRFPRPAQVEPPEPGTFGERAGAPWDALAALEASSADVELCRAVREAEQGFEDLSPSCRRELEAAAGPLAALLAATHAAEAGPPAGLGTLDAPTPPGHPRAWSTLPYAGKLGALRIRQLLSRGETAQAVQVCIDLQALARDASWGAALAGRLPALVVDEVAFRPCAAALDAAPTAVKRSAAGALARVEQGTPTFAAVMREYALGARAQAFAPYLGQLEGISPQIATWARENAPAGRTDWRFTLALGDAWHRIDARLDEAVKAAALPMPERAERLDVIAAGERPWVNRRAAFAFPQLGRAARSDARARAQLHLLRAAVAADLARSETGRWPSAAELATALGGGATLIESHGDVATLADPTVPRGELALSVRADAPPAPSEGPPPAGR
ncbi:MAG TPA: hypothetical protein VFN45_15240 [Myxococcaceae bacterium]|nr:hypothetical protein [Myxococcaceae bacterium]